MRSLPDMNSTGIIINGRRKRSEKENAILGSRIKLQHDEPECEDLTMIARTTGKFHKRSKSVSGINPIGLNTHKRVFGDLNASMAGVYGEDGLRDCAGVHSGL